MWSSYGVGQYAASEAHLCVASRLYKPDGTKRGCLSVHGRGVTATAGLGTGSSEVFANRGMPTLSVDGGGTATWGNDTSISRTTDQFSYISSAFGAASDKCVICAISMGTLVALNWVRTNASKVAAIALLIPVVDLTDIHDNNLNGWASEIETAYGGSTAYTNALPTHNPAQFTSTIAATNIPINIFYSTDDPTARPTPIASFAAAIGSNVTLTPIGANGHGLGSWDSNNAATWLVKYA